MDDYRGPLHLSRKAVEDAVPDGVPGSFALGHARPHESAAFISFVGRSDASLRETLLRHVGSHYTAFYWLPAASAEEAWLQQCALWHEMGGPDGLLHSGGHPMPPGNLRCPRCGF